MKAARVLLAAIVVVTVGGAALVGDVSAALQVHLPRIVGVDGERLSLGMISLVRAGDETLAEKVGAIAMGRAPWSKEKLVIDRPTILSRLATHGVGRDEVRFSGAEKVVVTRNEEVVKSERIVKAAEAFLAKTRPARMDLGGNCSARPTTCACLPAARCRSRRGWPRTASAARPRSRWRP